MLGFGERVRRRREQRGWTTRELGGKVGGKRSTISRIERGAMPRPRLRTKLVKLLDLGSSPTTRRGAHVPGPRPDWWPPVMVPEAQAQIRDAVHALAQAHRDADGAMTPTSLRATFAANTK